MTPEDNIAIPMDGTDESVGARLRSARTAANLTVVDVSTRLHLDARTIEHLEADDYDSLPAPTFVRGYLRGYARLLGLTPGPIVESFDRMGLAPPALVADISDHTETRSTDIPVRIATFGIIGVLVLLVFMWWQSRHGSEPVSRIASPEAAVTGETAPIAPPAPPAGPPMDRPLPAPVEPEAPGVSAVAPPVEAPVEPSGPGAAMTAGSAPPAPALPGNDAPGTGEPAPEGPVVSAEPGEDAPSPAPAAGAEEPRPEIAAPARATEDTGGRVEMSFAVESWVEIYDRSGERLFYNLAQPGAEIDLRGEPPFRVVLGRARGVTVAYNGRPFDYSPFVARGIARFELGRDRSGPDGGDDSRAGVAGERSE